MRNSFFKSLFDLAVKDPSIMVLSADMGFSVLEPFKDNLPKQYVNTGISEANTITMAASLALLGKKPYVYSIVPFITYRCLEQIRVDVCYQDLNVKIIGVGGGLDYAQSGTTHHSVEDISIMKSLPNMNVVCPADPTQARSLPVTLAKFNSPAYVRLGRGKEPQMHSENPIMTPPSSFVVSSKSELAQVIVISTGNISYNTKKAVDALIAKGFSLKLIVMPWIKPFDEATLLKYKSSNMFITVEEHSIVGGLGSSVSDIVCKNDMGVKVRHISLPDAFQKAVGSQEYIRSLNGLDPVSLERKIESLIKQIN